MNLTEKLDLAIKLKESGTLDGAYVTSYNGKALERNAYMTNEEWKTFKSSMSDVVLKEYGEGGGDELSEKAASGRPPKMASYGSSSRLIYTLSRDKQDFHYEKKLPTTVGGKANLDGFYDGGDHYVFVEAKCHEPYTAKNTSVSKSYKPLYEYINECMNGNLRIDMATSKCGKYLDVEYFANDEKLERFDIKQMICHLLGIATGMLNGTLDRKQTNFIYLLYDPTELNIDDLKAKETIDKIYERTCYECNLIEFSDLFRVILEFLRKEKFENALSDEDIDSIIYQFTFTLASQDFYPILIS